MVLYFIGLGLYDSKDISLKGLEIIKRSKHIFLENYTCKLNSSIKELEELYGNKIILADRDLVENYPDTDILKPAIDEDVVFLVIGDPMSATTHTDLWLRAKQLSIDVKIIHNASVLTAIGVTGLQLYKFGKTSSIVFPEDNWLPETPYDVVKMNKTNGLHTLLLLDIKVKEPSKEDIRKDKKMFLPSRYMTVNEAIGVMLNIENKRKEKIFTEETFCVGCSRLGSNDYIVKSGKAKDLVKEDFGTPLHCLIVPGELHFIEEEALKEYL